MRFFISKTYISTYETSYQTFLNDQKKLDDEQKAKEAEAKEKMGNFYRDTEANILKHNCIAYLLQSYATLGQEMSIDDGQRMQSFKMLFGDNLDNYTALAKFMEQAFEWQIMDYTFYPYYWASKAHWQNLYLAEDMDPLFRSFLQAGMARIIVTVKPGFENAVQFFMTIGKIWNGGEMRSIRKYLRK
ncbi:hypothetical protein [Chryseobacterium koreense]|uniref:hypothetical protein n=1 Tax=Chryseobacterium koreense TaxID=232216 RepID=UPI00069F1E61|nr:hypothetical protein [Chryseobacterium koreense]MBB5333955.1 hypothetical protein [Chryseobacterium koreense]